RALEAEEDWWTIFPEDELGQLLEWGWLLGVGLGELVPPSPIVAEERYVPHLKIWHPSALTWSWTERQWYVTVDGGGKVKVAPGDGRWILYMPYGASRPWAYGLWRGMARLCLLKQYALDDWGLHSEVHGQPLRVGISPAGANPELRKDLANDLANIGRDT